MLLLLHCMDSSLHSLTLGDLIYMLLYMSHINVCIHQ